MKPSCFSKEASAQVQSMIMSSMKVNCASSAPSRLALLRGQLEGADSSLLQSFGCFSQGGEEACLLWTLPTVLHSAVAAHSVGYYVKETESIAERAEGKVRGTGLA
ncbi:hypothetical protein MHYP_G00341810 [Metynnis hypsauchen]